jgi:RHS repeat-associated protein
MNVMLVPAGPIRVLVATKPVDFRKGMNGLAALVKERLSADPFSGVIYVFRSRRSDRIKLLFWDGSGMCLFEAAYRWDDLDSYGGAGPHAVSSINTTPGASGGCTLSSCRVDGISNPNFYYDADGNMLCVTTKTECTDGLAARAYSWTSFDMAETIVQGAGTTTFGYTPEHQRGDLGTAAGTIYYFSNPATGVFEELAQDGVTWHSYLAPYGHIVAEMFSSSHAISQIYYFAADHLGSTVSLTDTTGAQDEYDSYDAWGYRRSPSGADQPTGCPAMHPTSHSLRGFTGQEEMDSLCLINLNARLLDPTLGRMVSADPTIPDPLNGQAYNRYSYVANNPLTFTDASGYAEDGGEWVHIICVNSCGANDSGNIVDGSYGGMPSSGMPCWYCTGAGIANDIQGNPVPATNFSGGWNPYSVGWNGPNYGAPTCGGGVTSGCWTPTTQGSTCQSGCSSDTQPTSGVTTTTVNWSSPSYWVPGTSGIDNGTFNWGGAATGAGLFQHMIDGQMFGTGAFLRLTGVPGANAAINSLNKFYGPFSLGTLTIAQLVQTVSDIHNGSPAGVAVTGALINGTLIAGAGALAMPFGPEAAIGASTTIGVVLPSNVVMGQAASDGYEDWFDAHFGM